jgi:O-antigen ligase
MKFVLIFGMCFLALVFGAVAALFGGIPALVVAILFLPLLLVLSDYRIGVVVLTIVMPWSGSPLLPRAQGLNVINYLILLSVICLVAPRLLRGVKLVSLPRQVVWLFLVPVTIGMALAWPHIKEGAVNFATTDIAEGFQRDVFIKGHYIKPLLSVVYAWLLSNAVRDSKRPERFLAALAVASMLPVAVVFAGVALYHGNLSALQSARNFLSPFGLHANEFGLLVMTAAVPLMFVAASAKGASKASWITVFALVLVALVLTFSRGAWLGFAVGVLLFLFWARQARYTVAVLVIAVLAMIAAPHAVYKRLSTGVDEIGSREAIRTPGEDELTAGRVILWKDLLPDVRRSPLVGRGIGSTAWSTPMAEGRYSYVHPHNLYLEMLLDLGIAGLACLLSLYYIFLRNFKRLSGNEELPPLMRAYFAGAWAALIGLLVMGFSNGHYMPAPEQTFFWFSLGMLFGYWDRLPQKQSVAEGGKVRPRTFSYLPY